MTANNAAGAIILAAGDPSSSPIYAAFLSLISGALISGAIALYKARPDRELTVASTAEKQVVLSMSMLENERKRADRAEKRADEAEAERDTFEAQLVAMRAELADLTHRLELALTQTRSARDNDRNGGTPHA